MTGEAAEAAGGKGGPAGETAASPPPCDDRFCRWAEVAAGIGATTKRLEKLALLTAYLPTLDDRSLPVAARFFSGILFPRHDMRTTQVGGSIIYGALQAVTGATDGRLEERWVALGDTGDLVGEMMAGRAACGITLGEVEALAAELAATRGTNARREVMRALFARMGAEEARFFTKLLGGEMRIGLKEAQVEEAVARAFGRPLEAVRRANLLRGDVGEVALLARRGALESATLALFHPLGFMLAQPLETPAEIVAALTSPFAVEDKYDGIRAQAHVQAGRVALFSRTLDAITHGYPEVAAALGGVDALAGGVVLDGELLVFDATDAGRPLPFKALQTRLGRKAPSAELVASLPVSFVAYDILAAEGRLVIDEPYTARRARLEAVAWPGRGARLAPNRMASSVEEVETAFVAARAAGNEGIIAKDLASPYTPGRRGKQWIKLKRAMATLDVVVTAVERGHGKRRAVLSDYTFAVRASESDPTLLEVGKAFTGLTDAEIAAMTERFKALTVERRGGWHRVRPEVVLEVTFDIVQRSDRHPAGYALRFPRIVRVRDDKPPAEVDTLARVRELAGDGGAEGGDAGA
ncbi:MAG TPA: ATP-dependent DNA ligase, partial [Gemmatimonadaceae bacterium]|nr:ATP-dependent DNA ligase [Gemmatimonadaceae bacterium]